MIVEHRVILAVQFVSKTWTGTRESGDAREIANNYLRQSLAQTGASLRNRRNEGEREGASVELNYLEGLMRRYRSCYRSIENCNAYIREIYVLRQIRGESRGSGGGMFERSRKRENAPRTITPLTFSPAILLEMA